MSVQRSSRNWAFALFAIALVIAPLVFRSSLATTVLSQIGYTIIICLSFNILLGQGGMLSFGHAVYTGLGALLTVHVLQTFAIPLVWMPLVGGLGGAGIAVLLGYVSTRKSGSTFAMITLGLGELVAALALMFPQWFGGEGGISINRVYGTPWLGLSFGPAIQVYYLIAAYCFACTVAMYAFTKTPLGQLLNAVRDNPQRAEFIGYNPQRVRYLAFIIAGFFAGIGGALATIHFEIFSAADSLGMARSGSWLVFTFLGGTTVFFGPMIGAVLLVCSTVLLSGLTKAWLLYLGLIFIVMVMYAPGGVASLLVNHGRMARSGALRTLWPAYLATVLAALLAFTGASALIEMLYHHQFDAMFGPSVEFLGITLNTAVWQHWAAAAAVTLIGWALFETARKHLAGRLSVLQPEEAAA